MFQQIPNFVERSAEQTNKLRALWTAGSWRKCNGGFDMRLEVLSVKQLQAKLMPCLQKQLAKQGRKVPVITFDTPLWLETLETPSIASLICQMIATGLHGALHGGAQAKSSPWIRKTPKASDLLRGELNQCHPAGHVMRVQRAVKPQPQCSPLKTLANLMNKL